ncbi:MAG: type II toxin-antitoxin system VapB family antitoxin [Kaiparowitsia implicata GSE-PSE-MK54-09C]|jgi:antitoxin VapB|nr:type II toxin-antitoxin system VapB family antitoxin [Kaiparowitsia implicata GSE-PSE-MK54-09C]
MKLPICDPRADRLARQLAERGQVALTEAVSDALDALTAENSQVPLAERLRNISRQLKANGAAGGHEMTKEEINDLWGHS